VLEDIGLAVGPGDIHALLGRNGAGNCTLARTLMGCGGALTGGSMRFGGEDLAGLAVHERAHRGIRYSTGTPTDRAGLRTPLIRR
jgi:Fe-S cluster assembly ATPase SufC